MSDKEDELEKLDEISDGVSVALVALIARNIIDSLGPYLLINASSASIFGLLSVLQRSVGFIISLSKGISESLIRTLPRLDQLVKNQIFTLSIFLSFIYWIFFSGLIIINSELILSLTSIPSEQIGVIPIFGTSILFYLLIGMFTGVFYAEKKIRIANIFGTVGKPLVFLIGSLSGLTLFQGLFSAWTGVTLFLILLNIGAFGFLALKTDYRPVKPSKRYNVREFMGYLKNVQVEAIFSTIQYHGVFVLMAIFLDAIAAGLFSLSWAIARLIRLPLDSVNQIFPPIMTDLHQERRKELLNSLYQRTSLLILFLSLPIFIFQAVYFGEILSFFSNKFSFGTSTLAIIAGGQIVAVTAGSVGLMLKMTDHERESMWLQIALVSIILPISIILTVAHGLIGLAVSTAAFLIFNNLAELSLLKYETGIFPFTMRHLKTAIVGVIPLAGALLSKPISLQASLTVFVLFTMIYLIASYRYLLEQKDRRLLKTIIDTLELSR